jgi:hypothetical protein
VNSTAPCRAPPAPICPDLPAGGVGSLRPPVGRSGEIGGDRGSLRPPAELFEEPESEEGHHV